MHQLGRQPTVGSVMLFGVVDILFSCTPRLFTSETMVHRDRTRSYRTACVVPSEPSEAVMELKKEQCAQNVVCYDVGLIT